MKYTFRLAVVALSFFTLVNESCKSHKKDKLAQDAMEQAIADSVAYSAAMDSMYDLPEYEFDAKSAASENRYNASAKRVNDLLNTKLEVSFNFKTAQLNGKATIDIQPYFYATDSLILDAKSFDIEKVALVSKEGTMSDLNFKYDSTQLHIGLGKLYTKKEPYRIFIQYKANPNKVKNTSSAAITDAKGLYFIDNNEEDDEKPTQIWTQGETESNSCWFPTIDKPNEKMTHEIQITVPKKYKTLSNGLMASTKENSDGTRTDIWKMDMPNTPYLVMMAIGEYAVVKDTWRKIAVDYYVEPKFEPYAKEIFGNTPEMLEFFSKKLGVDYPWPKYSQVVVRDYVSGAMENTSATIFGEFIQQTPKQRLDSDFEDVIAHELFHHWFGDLVTCESWSNLPLNESFATYSEYLWNEYKYGRDAADYHLASDLKTYLEESLQKQENLIRFNYEFREDMFDRHSYQKGGTVLHMLRKYVGDEAFFESLKTYLNENRFQTVEIHNLRLAFEKVTGEDLNWFFNQWFLGKGHPTVEAAAEYNAENKTVAVVLSQTPSTDDGKVFQLPLDIDVYVNGKVNRTRVVMKEDNEVFTLNADAEPSLVVVDAENMLCGRLNMPITVEQAQFQYLNAPLYNQRLSAVEVLGQNADQPGVSSVLKLALNDKFWNIRLLTLKAIEPLLASETEYKSTLEQIAKNDKKSAVRAEAIRQLMAYNKQPGVFELFAAALNDSSAQVQGSAIAAMYQTDADKTREMVEKMETTATGDMLTSIAAIYTASAVPNKLEFFKTAYGRINEPNDKYFFVQIMGKYALSQNEGIVYSALPTFENIAKTSKEWWLRLSAIQVLAELQTFYDGKVDELSSSIAEIKEKGTDVFKVQTLEMDQTLLKKKSTEIDVILDTIRETEKDPNLTRILNMVK